MTYELVEDDELLAPSGVSFGNPGDESQDEDCGDVCDFNVGFSDSRRAVAIWVDAESRHLARVHLSSSWRERLANASLEEAFHEAFFLANARVGEVATLARPSSPEPIGDPHLGWADYPAVLERVEQLTERLRQLDQLPADEIEWADYKGEAVTGASSNGHVTVNLSLAGLTQRVAFDKRWLATAPTQEIVHCVLHAHERAYARYTPPTYVPGDHDRLSEELAGVRADLMSILTKEVQ